MKNNKIVFITGIGLIIFLSPFVVVSLSRINYKLTILDVLNLGLPLKDFYTVWISLWGVIGIMVTIYFNYRRLNNQDIQISQLTDNEQQNRFSKAIELLGGESESTRIGGCVVLYNYAIKNSYNKEIVFELFCSHIRSTTSQDSYIIKYKAKPSNEVQFILNFLFKKDKNGTFQFINNRADLSGSYLVGTDLEEARIVAANLSNVNLSSSELTDCNFKASKFKSTTLNSCNLNRTRFDYAYFFNCFFDNITNACVFMNFSFVQNSFFRNFTCEEGCEFKGVYFESISFINVSFFETNLIGAKIRREKNIVDTKFNDCLIAGIDDISRNIINNCLIRPIEERFCNKQEDITNFEYLVHPIVRGNVVRYNNIPVNI